MSVDDFGVVADLTAGADRRPRSLGMWAVLTGVVTAEQLQEAYAGWEERGEAPGEMFVRNGWMTEQMVADALGELSGLPVVRAAQRSEDPDVLGALSAEEAWRLEACPLERDGDGNLVVALADPSDARLRALRAQLGPDIRPVIVVNSQLRALLDDPRTSSATFDEAPSTPAHPAEDDGETDTGAHRPAPSPQVEAAEDPAAASDQLERLHERLVSEHVQSTDELVANRRKLAELADEQARLQASVTALEASIAALDAKVGEEELVLSLIEAKLREHPQAE
jgi:hypothetical protein